MVQKKKKFNKKRKNIKLNKMLEYTPSEMKKIEDYITQTYGSIEAIIHDSNKTKLHIDLCIVAPDGQRPYWKVITMGMGKFKMKSPNIPSTLEYPFNRCELVMAVEPFWDYSSLYPTDSHVNPSRPTGDLARNYYYPIQVLKNIAMIPIETKDFFNIPLTTELPGAKFDVDTDLDEFLLLPAQDIGSGKNVAFLPNKEPVAFYQVVPITHSERLEASKPGKFNETINKINYVFWPERESTV